MKTFLILLFSGVLIMAAEPDFYAAPTQHYNTLFLARDNNSVAPENLEFTIEAAEKELLVTVLLMSTAPSSDAQSTGSAQKKTGKWPTVDSVELFFDPGSDGRYFQVAGGIDGTLFDSRFIKGEWLAAWTATIEKVEKGKYRIIFRFPYVANSVPRPNPGDVWRFNLCHNVTGKIPYSATAAKVGSNFHSPEKFALLGFGSPAEFHAAADTKNQSMFQDLKKEIINSKLDGELSESISRCKLNENSIRALRDEFEVLQSINNRK